MKNKYTKYLLLVGTVAIWGTIIWKIIDARSGDKQDAAYFKNPATVSLPVTKPANYILLEDYPDPFLKKEMEQTDTLLLTQQVVPAAPAPPPVSVDFIQYHGMISNTDAPKKAAFASFHGEEKMIQAGDVITDVKIRTIQPASMTVEYKGKRFTIKKL